MLALPDEVKTTSTVLKPSGSETKFDGTSVGLGAKLLIIGILNFGPCAMWGHQKQPGWKR